MFITDFTGRKGHIWRNQWYHSSNILEQKIHDKLNEISTYNIWKQSCVVQGYNKTSHVYQFSYKNNNIRMRMYGFGTNKIS